LKAIIIGSGVAGLATAVRLAAAGNEVTVLESAATYGGKMGLLEQDGFRFDTGPSLFTMPYLVDDLLKLAPQMDAAWGYEKLDVACHYFYEDGVRIQAHATPEKFAAEVTQKLGVSEQVVLDYLNHCRQLFEWTSKTFLEKSLHELSTYLSRDALQAVQHVFQLGLFQSMHESNQERLKHPKLVQLFNRFATYNGSSPYKAPGVLNNIAHLEHNQGAFFPKGGMRNIADQIYRAAVRLGVTFQFDTRVTEIVVADNRAVGVKTGQEQLNADVVVSNMDIVPTYNHLLKSHRIPNRIKAQEPSSSALIFYWGIKGNFDELGVHNILFSDDYQSEFEHIFDRQELNSDPTVYINITSKKAPSDAPAGCENWFVMINVPALPDADWQALAQTAKKRILAKLQRVLKVDIAPLIMTENVLDPSGIATQTSSHLGALYGPSSNNRLAAFLRHPNFSPQIKHLYFCGGSVHPGGGVPLCLLSAKIVADRIQRNEK